jgi:hypothetical protein
VRTLWSTTSRGPHIGEFLLSGQEQEHIVQRWTTETEILDRDA